MKAGDWTTLLEDLARLLRKHGPRAFEELAAELSRPGFVAQLSEILATVAATGRAERRAILRHSPQKRRSSDTQEWLEPRVGDDPERQRMLESIRERLRDVAFFPRLQDVRDFADRLSLHPPATGKREQVVRALVQELSLRDTTELRTVVVQLTGAGERSGLGEWSDLIFPKDGPR